MSAQVMKLSDDVRELFRKQGQIGGKKRAARLSPERRSEIARAAAEKRWAAKSKPRKATEAKSPKGGQR